MSTDLLQYQKSYLLIQLLTFNHIKVKKGEANQLFTKDKLKKLGFKNKTQVNTLRETLCKQGLIQKSKSNRTEYYQLTDQGVQELIQLEQYPSFQYPAKTLNNLFALLAKTNFIKKAIVTEALKDEKLQEIILKTFEKLLREQYSADKKVPIYALRDTIQASYGEINSNHTKLDKILIQLDKKEVIRIIAISDKQNITTEQLNNSIQGVDEILFYIKEV